MFECCSVASFFNFPSKFLRSTFVVSDREHSLRSGAIFGPVILIVELEAIECICLLFSRNKRLTIDNSMTKKEKKRIRQNSSAYFQNRIAPRFTLCKIMPPYILVINSFSIDLPIST